MLWTGLRRGNIGFHFRRQHPAPPFTLDFYCARARLAVEVDGVQHEQDEHARDDAWRDGVLAQRGISMLRVSAVDVMHNPDGVLMMIAEAVRGRLSAVGEAEAEGAATRPPSGPFGATSPASRERDA
jgi:very-short-patch-repair endonuclease